MNTPNTITNRDGLEKVLVAAKLTINAYEHVIGLDHPEATKLRDHVLQSIGKINRERRRLEAVVAKATVNKKAK